MHIEAKLHTLGLVLPEPLAIPPTVRLPFAQVRVRGNRAYISGHGPQAPDGSLALPLGKVGADVSLDEAYQAARLTGLSILADLKRTLGDLDQVTAWLRVFGMVNSAPGFTQQPAVINGFSDLILELYGTEAGQHARSAVGMAELPFRLPVEIELCDFSFYRFPRNGMLEQICYTCRLVAAYMVKLKDANIGLTTINTWVIG
jgi:enamine deaminase RidA (YjgF/YER057c/UK114 family)